VIFRAPQDLVAELRNAASREQMTVSELLRRAAREFLAAGPEKKEAAPPGTASTQFATRHSRNASVPNVKAIPE
jgi:hypothetical protein